jgi:PAS domain S-box-containing protein
MDTAKHKDQHFGAALLDWFSDFAPLGILVTDLDLTIVSVNGWFKRHFEHGDADPIGRTLLEVVPELEARGFARYYADALSGQTRVLSHRFHKYLIPMRYAGGTEPMQQRATVSPLQDGDVVVGTVTMIEDVTERVLREKELSARVKQSEDLLARERSARELAEENVRLRDRAERLDRQGRRLEQLNEIRKEFLHCVIESQEDERLRIARDIHDHLGQRLTALRLSLSVLRCDLDAGRDPFGGLDRLELIAREIDADIDFISRDLRPSMLDDLGLEESLRQFVRQWSHHFGVEAEFHSSGFDDPQLPPKVAINLYRITQEALNNVAKHARAAHVSLLLENRDDSVTLVIEDDGVGFDPDGEARPAGVGRGSGLVGMKERVALIGGGIEIESAMGRGTTVYVRVEIREIGSAAVTS